MSKVNYFRSGLTLRIARAAIILAASERSSAIQIAVACGQVIAEGNKKSVKLVICT